MSGKCLGDNDETLAPVYAIVMASGMNTRFGGSESKLLTKINGKPIIKHLVDSLHDAGIRNIIMVVGHSANLIIKALKGKNIAFIRNNNYERTEQIYSFSLAEPHIPKNATLLLTDGDIIIPSKTIRKILMFKGNVIPYDPKKKPTIRDIGINRKRWLRTPFSLRKR